MLAFTPLGYALIDAVFVYADMLVEEVSTEAIVAIVDFFANCMGRIGPCNAHLQTDLVLEEHEFGEF